MRYQLVFQILSDDIDFDTMVDIEEELISRIGRSRSERLDGHDAGSGEINFFIHTDTPKETFDKCFCVFENRQLHQLKSAFRELNKDDYVIMWPIGCKTFNIV
jgi:hypothetical protein